MALGSSGHIVGDLHCTVCHIGTAPENRERRGLRTVLGQGYFESVGFEVVVRTPLNSGFDQVEVEQQLVV